ncbi:hypothetical protein CI109_103844 [Kwoniella shandongensis]|uniref:Uncharacterized protein n=1 Tax=Kwoniella shandongensis TaxID=1734106 RepID=A0A5M6C8B1_9TREE|nr:uncharacterized protein CI109_000460 [Kwoniella shandongensis]KAA5530890.1 hypothetical protein CI109_000460 [Kwoniella shandongensis]
MSTAEAGPSKPRSKPLPVPVEPFLNPADDEERTVHSVYEAIAPHFSQTRHKPWPLIATFLHSLPPNAIGLDSGAGNGKYLPVSRDAGLEMIALDRSSGLLEIARKENGGECVRGDLGFDGWRRGVFDFAISVAAIHHLSTPQRRRHSVQVLLRPLKLSPTAPYSRFLIYVWAYEQGEASKRKMGTAAKVVGEDGDVVAVEESVDGKVQDVLVPWVLSKKKLPAAKSGNNIKSTSSTIPSVEDTKPTTNESDSPTPPTTTDAEPTPPPPQVFHRYYHLFVEGELRELVESAGKEEGFVIVQEGEELPTQGKWLRVRGVGWEADNWWLEGEVGGES